MRAKNTLFCTKRWSRLYSTALDKKWIERWASSPPRKPNHSTGNAPYMCLSMFPYPSGALHMGHLRVYTISDVISRYRRMNNYDVIHAMGWDAFGLPAENAALEHGVDASEWTYRNIDSMRQQMNKMLADFDWEREVVTCSPEYYKWTQKLFLMMYESGLAFRKKAEVNWDPVDKTVLANEQVDSEGKSWRSGAKVQKKLLDQWFLGITKYADRLLDDLDLLKEWPEKVKSMQKNWIGRSKGSEITFLDKTSENSLKIFTTRPDTLFGVSYIAVSLNHPLTKEFASKDTKLAQFVREAADFTDGSKAGFKIPGFFVSNPLTPNKFDIPVYVAPYVLGHYGSAAVMGCPAHDVRDSEFWKINGDKPALKVIDAPEKSDVIYTGKDGVLNAHCGEYAGMTSEKGGQKIVEDLESKGFAKSTTQLRLRDWLISRQRFWGTPIPIVHCDNCGTVPVPDDQLPVLLPEDNTQQLFHNEEFLETTCPTCHGPARRDSDTMDTFMDSSWYFFRYCDPNNADECFDYSKVSKAMPVDLYIGGIEHAILHLLYARFVSKFLADANAWSGGTLSGEPIKKLVSQGMVQGKTFIDPTSGAFLKPAQIKKLEDGTVVTQDGRTPSITFEKMSKSKFNGVDPEGVIERHGADATRAHILFQGPVQDAVNWDEDKIIGIERWLKRVQTVVDDVCDRTQPTGEWSPEGLDEEDKRNYNEIQSYVRNIGIALDETMTLNTLISDYMKLTRLVMSIVAKEQTARGFKLYAVKTLVQLIAPVTPSNAEEAWEKLQKFENSNWTTVFAEDWPQPRNTISLSQNNQHLIIANGRRLGFIDSEKISDAELTELVLQHEKVQEFLKNRKLTKILIPEKQSKIIILTK